MGAEKDGHTLMSSVLKAVNSGQLVVSCHLSATKEGLLYLPKREKVSCLLEGKQEL
jgi:hypothetical protein